jgi:hypothetical protein
MNSKMIKTSAFLALLSNVDNVSGISVSSSNYQA